MQPIENGQPDEQDQFVWKTQPAAARWVTRAIESLTARNPTIEKLARLLREFTGTRLVDWIDHFALSDEDSLGLIGELADVGYVQQNSVGEPAWQHPLGMFPPVRFFGRANFFASSTWILSEQL